jgi:hypothetical protein
VEGAFSHAVKLDQTMFFITPEALDSVKGGAKPGQCGGVKVVQ